jgi:F-type H+-transporting ATPase subunit b
MKRALLALCFCGALVVSAQEHSDPGTHPEGSAQEHNEPGILWKWANFALLVAGLGYLVAKNAPAFFNERDEEIRKGLADAAVMKAEADQRTAAMEARMRNLETEIENLRRSSKEEMRAESQRLRQETESLVAKIKDHAGQEIASATRAARLELRRYTAELAIEKAAMNLRAQITPATDNQILSGFLKGLNN